MNTNPATSRKEHTAPSKDRQVVKPIRPANRIVGWDENVWEWIPGVIAASPIQPMVNLGTGFIEYNPPDFIVQAHKDALQHVQTNQYAPITGLDSLKNAIADVYSPLYGKTLDPNSEVSVHSGAQEGLLACVMAFVQPGDEVILLEPVFQMYEYQVLLAGGTPRFVPLHPPSSLEAGTVSGNDWTLDMTELEAAVTPNTRMLVLNNPHNPIGKVYTTEEMLAIGRLCVKYNIILMSDEVYEHLSFIEGAFSRMATLEPSIAAITLTASSLGKLFNATGWRVGFVIGPQHLIKFVVNAHLITAYASSSPAQEAAARALRAAETNGFWETNNRDVQHRVGRICDVLTELEIPFVYPAGAYFLFLDISRISIPAGYEFPEYVKARSRDFKVCYFMINEIGVSSIPGSCFYCDEHGHLGSNYIRFGACKSDDGLDLAVERLRKLKPLLTPKKSQKMIRAKL